MRGDDQPTGHLFTYLSPEQRVPTDHPLRTIRRMTDEALGQLSPGWMKTVGGIRKLRHRGGARVEWQFLSVASADNLVGLPNLPAETA